MIQQTIVTSTPHDVDVQRAGGVVRSLVREKIQEHETAYFA